MPYIMQQLLSESAGRHPDQASIWARERTLSYRNLDESSNQLAHLLRFRGVRKGDRIGLCSSKCVELVVSMFGVMKASAVYVPLDPQAPVERLSYIIGNCGLKGLITTEESLRPLELVHLPCVEFVILIGQSAESSKWPRAIPWSAARSFPSSHPPESQPISTDLAYILYTSGSTGRPKGVMLSHQNALTFVEWCAETFQIRKDDRLSNHAPLHFDLSVFDIYNSIKAGATTYMIPEEVAPFPASLVSFIEAQRITVWYSVPSALIYLLLHGNIRSRDLRCLRLVLFAGEVLPMKYLRQLAELLPAAELYNLYGPTETNVCTYYRVDRSRLANMDRLPIGKACANTEVFAVNEHDEPIKPGQEGELYVRGPSVTSGYWRDPDKTARVVVSNRFQPAFDERIYRTGDIVTLDEDGNYFFLGRRDGMIKSRGFRIELGEIEATLLSHPGVREAVSVPIPDEEIGARLKAIVVPHHPNSLTAIELQQHCASRLPSYMIPEWIEFCESLPRTSTGKVDRVQLAGRARPAGN